VSVPIADWRDMAVDWYLNPDDLDVPLVLDKGEQPLQGFTAITPDEATTPPAVPITTDGHVISETLENERLSFDTTAIGQPHWIKISYFPNWHVEGAEGPYLVSPSFMMVIPTESHVTLYYGRTGANTIGQTLEILAWLLLLGLATWRTLVWRRRRRLAGAVHQAGPEDVLAGVAGPRTRDSSSILPAPRGGGGESGDSAEHDEGAT